DLLRKDDVELQQVDLNDVVRVVHDILKPQATDMGCLLTLDDCDHLLPVRADPVHLQQVVLNLALNRIDTMAGSMSENRHILFQTRMGGVPAFACSVADRGAGIPAGQLQSIFEPFFTVKKRDSELGLPISREIIEGFGGRIWAENRAGGGTI